MAEQCGDCQRFIGRLSAMEEPKIKPGDYKKLPTSEGSFVALRTYRGQLVGSGWNKTPKQHFRVQFATETNDDGKFFWRVGLLCQVLGK